MRDGTTIPTDLVQLAPGAMDRPLFLVHAVGGHVYSYTELASQLRLDQAVLGLPRPEGRRDLDSIEAIARAYVERVRAVQPAGPYRVGGWSFGGSVAFEMAAQLRAAGEQVTALLLDSPVPTPFRYIAAAVEARSLRQFAAEFGQDAESDPADAAALEALPRDERLAVMLTRIRGTPAARSFDPEHLAQFLRVLSDNIGMWCRYAPQRPAGTVLQFRAADPAAFLGERLRGVTDALGWDAHATDVAAHEVPGDHFSMLRGEAATHLAAAMRPYLQ